jgi:hypothetical protein
MNVSEGERLEEFVAKVVSSGRYARGGERTDEQIAQRLAKEFEKTKRQGKMILPIFFTT